MARNPISVFKRPTAKKGKATYYIKLWDEKCGVYTTPRAAASIIKELHLDPRVFSPTSRTGALLIGQELLRQSGAVLEKSSDLFADYCTKFWDWDTSDYILGHIARGLRIGKEYVAQNASYVKNYIRPAFPAMKLRDIRPYHLESFILSLKKEGKIRNKSINAILASMRLPLKEAARLGHIPSDPGAYIRKLGNDRREKGIPTTEELTAILALNLDLRIRACILLGSVCGLRLGEVQALKLSNINENTLKINASWGKKEGYKTTKNGISRIVPLPEIVKDALSELEKTNPHGADHYLIYGLKPDAPLDRAAIGRAFKKTLVRITLGEKYSKSTKKEKNDALKLWETRNVTFHSLRHFTNAELRGSVPDATLRKLTGHLTEEMTDHYDHTTDEDIAALAKAQECRIIPFIKSA